MHKWIYLILFFTSLAWGHKINIFVSEENNGVEIYSYFASGDACKACNLVIQHNGEVLIDTKLNEEGKYYYQSSVKSFNIIVDALGGHKAEKSIELENFKNESLQKVLEEDKKMQYLKIAIALFLIGLFFYLLRRVKKNAK